MTTIWENGTYFAADVWRRFRLFAAKRLGIRILAPRLPPPSFQTIASIQCLTLSVVDTFRFVDQPYQVGQEGIFIGREGEVQDLAMRILFSDGGAVLVTGYRGVGKTSFVNKAISLVGSMAPAFSKPGECLEILPIHFNFSRELAPEELMYHIIRRLYHELRRRGILKRLHREVKQWLEAAYKRTIYSMASKSAIATLRESDIGLREFGVTDISIGAGFGIKRSKTQTSEEQLTYLPYSSEAAEYDIIQILHSLSAGYKRGRAHVIPKIVLVLDELDKIESYKRTDAGRVPNPYIEQVFGSLKTLLTTSGITFICVAGRDFYELWRAGTAREDSVLESVFAHHIYVGCLWDLPQPLLDQALEPLFRITPTPSATETSERLVVKLKGYLRYKSRGIARRVHRELNSFILWHEGKMRLVFDDNSVRRLDFYDQLDLIFGLT